MPSEEATKPAGPSGEDRSRARYGRVVASVGATFATRLGQIAIGLVSVRVALHAYGPARYGLWLTVSSLLIIATLLDQGLGYPVVQGVAEAEGRADARLAREWISTAMAVNAVLAVGLVIVALLLFPLIPWHTLLGVADTVAASEAGPVMSVFVVCFGANLVAGVVLKAQTGLQLGFVTATWQLVGSGVALAGTILVAHLGAALPWLVLVLMGTPAMVTVAAGLLLFQKRPDLRPRLADVRRGRAANFLSASGFVGATAAATALAVALDNLMVSHALGVAAVAAFALPWRLFSMAQSLLSSYSQALWPAYAEAVSRREPTWATLAFRRALALTGAGSAVAATGFYLLREEILWVWVGNSVTADASLFAGFGVVLVVSSVGVAMSQFLAALGGVRVQAVLSVMVVALVLPAKWLLVERLGAAAIPWVMAVAVAFVQVVPMGLVTRAKVKELSAHETQPGAKVHDPG